MKLIVSMAAIGLAATTFAAGAFAQDSVESLYEAAKAEGRVVFYTSQVGAVEQRIADKFSERYPGIDVEVVYAGGGVLYDRLTAEAQAGRDEADVHLQSDMSLMERLQGAGLLAQWNPPEAAVLPAEDRGDGYWTTVANVVNVIIYNNLKVSAEDAPRSWSDLFDPKWKGRIATVHIGGGGLPWSQFYFLRKTYPDSWEKLAANEPAMFDGGGAVLNAVVSGTSDIGLLGASISHTAVVDGAPITEVAPSDGLPGVKYGIAVLGKAPHPNAARLFVNWYVSEEGQRTLVDIRGVLSPRDDVPPAATSVDTTGVAIVVPTLAELGAVREQWFAEWNETFNYLP
jgi:iron(III) transport system substrate-binding protein